MRLRHILNRATSSVEASIFPIVQFQTSRDGTRDARISVSSRYDLDDSMLVDS